MIEDPVNVMNNGSHFFFYASDLMHFCIYVYRTVAKNCYNAASVQRAFVGANERFKNTVTRYSGRVGSALAGGVSKTRRGFIKDVGCDIFFRCSNQLSFKTKYLNV